MQPCEHGDKVTNALLRELDRAVKIAEDLSTSHADSFRDVANVRDHIIPALFHARTYLAVDKVCQPEVELSLTVAIDTASSLADKDHRYSRLLSRLRVLREQVARAIRAASFR